MNEKEMNKWMTKKRMEKEGRNENCECMTSLRKKEFMNEKWIG